MAQYKKDDIMKKIDAAALYIFAEKGYGGTSISDIAEKAKVSVGNIYRYYKGKDEIFYSIAPEDFLNKLNSILLDKINSAKETVSGGRESSGTFSLINEEFIEFIATNRERILIMFIGAEGTKYEAMKDEVINYLIKTVKENYSEQNNEIIFENKNYFVIKTIYSKHIEMMMDILKAYSSPSEIKSSLNIINSYHLFGVANLFK